MQPPPEPRLFARDGLVAHRELLLELRHRHGHQVLEPEGAQLVVEVLVLVGADEPRRKGRGTVLCLVGCGVARAARMRKILGYI